MGKGFGVEPITYAYIEGLCKIVQIVVRFARYAAKTISAPCALGDRSWLF